MRGPDSDTIERSRRLRRTQTEVERKLWGRLRNRQVGGAKFVRQEPIGPYFADFACREHKIIVELDGHQHADSPRDQVRDAYMVALGYQVLRFWNGEVNATLQVVLDTIFAALDEPAPPLPMQREEVVSASADQLMARRP